MTAKINVQITAQRTDVKSIVESKNNTSWKMRSLHALSVPTGEIALLLEKKYQHVRNVLNTPVKQPKQQAEPIQLATAEEFAEAFGK